jgi:hypothetical protein
VASILAAERARKDLVMPHDLRRRPARSPASQPSAAAPDRRPDSRNVYEQGQQAMPDYQSLRGRIPVVASHRLVEVPSSAIPDRPDIDPFGL